MFAIGNRVGRYEIVARLKEGGMATLFVGRPIEPSASGRQKVAIKVVHPEMAKHEDFVRMFVDEAYLSARIRHPNVVQVEELGQADGTYFLVMEYVEGCSLAQLLDALIKKSRRMSPDLAVSIAMEVADGLHAAHETRGDQGELLGVVHRDVSPQNVLVSDRGHVKLIDFGIAKARIRGRKTTVGSLKGKLRYMAPEQAFGRPVDRRTDVYALGIVLWEMLVLRHLFDGRNDLEVMRMVQDPAPRPPSLAVPDVPLALDAVILSALAKDPDERPASAMQLRERLAEAMPRAAALDASDLAELLAATMDDAQDADERPAPAAAEPAMASDQATVVQRRQRGSLRPGRTREQVLRSLTIESMAPPAAATFATEPTPADDSAAVELADTMLGQQAPLAATPPPAAEAPAAPGGRAAAERPSQPLEPGAAGSRRSRASVIEARVEDVHAATAEHLRRASEEPAKPPAPDAGGAGEGLWAKLKRMIS